MKARASFVGLSVFIIAGLGSAHGQVVIGSAAPPSPAPTMATAPRTSPLPGALSSLASAFANQAPLLQRGPLAVRPHVSYTIRYGNDILRVPGEPENTWMHTFSPGVLLTLGDRWSFDYTIARNMYSSRLIEDTTNHNARLSGGFSRGDWTFGASQSYGSNSPTLVETGGQTQEETFSTSGTALYDLGPRTAIELSANRSQREASPLYRSTSWTGSDWVQWSGTLTLRYGISQRLKAATGVTVGYDEVSANPDMTHSQPHLQLTWTATDKIAFSAKAGLENRKSSTSGAKRQKSGVYNVSANYSPLQTTSISVSANQSVGSSYFSDQTTKNTGWGISLSQRLAQRFFATGGFSHGRTTYIGTTTLSPIGRDDKYRSFNLGVGTRVLRRGSVSLSYQHSENLSNATLFGFESDTYRMETSYSF